MQLTKRLARFLIFAFVCTFVFPVPPAGSFKTDTHEYLFMLSVESIGLTAEAAYAEGDGQLGDELADIYQFFSDPANNETIRAALVRCDTLPLLFTPSSIPLRHGTNPDTGKGWAGEMSSQELAETYFVDYMTRFFQTGDIEAFNTGVGLYLHLYGDIHVPHHLAKGVLDGHAEYEAACLAHQEEWAYPTPNALFSVGSLKYGDMIYYGGWISDEAESVRDRGFYEQVNAASKEANFEKVARILMPEAVRNGACLLIWIYRDANQTRNMTSPYFEYR